MKIPAQFDQFGQTIRVSIIPLEAWPHGEDCVGLWNPQANEIDIRGDQDRQAQEATYCHELTHAMLDGLSHPLSSDEVFVDTFGRLMHQAFFGCKFSVAKRRAAKRG